MCACLSVGLSVCLCICALYSGHVLPSREASRARNGKRKETPVRAKLVPADTFGVVWRALIAKLGPPFFVLYFASSFAVLGAGSFLCWFRPIFSRLLPWVLILTRYPKGQNRKLLQRSLRIGMSTSTFISQSLLVYAFRAASGPPRP